MKIKNNKCDDFSAVNYMLKNRNGKCYVDITFKSAGQHKRTEYSAKCDYYGLKKSEKRKILDEAKNKFERLHNMRRRIDYRLCVNELIDKWMDGLEGTVRTSTLNSYKIINEAHLRPYFGKMLVVEVTVDEINSYKNYKLNTDISNNTVIKHLKQLRSIFKFARELGIIDSNPAELVKLPRKEKFHSNIYELEDLRKLTEAVKNTKLELPVVLAYCCGLRREEILGLRYSDISQDFSKLHIRNTYINDGNENVFIAETKNDTSNRHIKMCNDVKKCIIENKKKQEKNKEILGEKYNDENFICTDEMGNPIKPNYISQTFKKIIEKNNLKQIRFHDLRHSVATELYRQGIDIGIVSQWLGHSSTAITESVYVHKNENDTTNTIDILNQLGLYGD